MDAPFVAQIKVDTVNNCVYLIPVSPSLQKLEDMSNYFKTLALLENIRARAEAEEDYRKRYCSPRELRKSA